MGSIEKAVTAIALLLVLATLPGCAGWGPSTTADSMMEPAIYETSLSE